MWFKDSESDENDEFPGIVGASGVLYIASEK